MEAIPYRIHTVATDNGIQFCHPPGQRFGPTAPFSMHRFDRLCRQHGIEHRLTKPNHPWTNGQVERTNRIIKHATVKRYYYADHQPLAAHLELFLNAYDHARRLKTLKGLTPHEYACRIWTVHRVRTDSSHRRLRPSRRDAAAIRDKAPKVDHIMEQQNAA